MTPCSWPCTKVATTWADGYWHCDEHLAEHRRQRREDARKNQPAKTPSPQIDLKPCGTWAAYQRHKRHGEDIDDACREALRRRGRDQATRRREKAGAIKRRITEVNIPDLISRYENGETLRSICDDLKLGRRRIELILTKNGITVRPRVLQPCGTRAAYVRHLRHHETPCKLCCAAEVEHRTKYARSGTRAA